MKRDRIDLFDSWAARYDESLSSDACPLAGHDEVAA